MDVQIQSQIQSPLVRTLQSIPTNSANFVHGIPDNTPPFSRTSVKVQASTGDPDKASDLHVFKVPQNGHLNRAYLRYRMYGHATTVGGAVVATDNDNPFSFGEGIEWVQMRTHNNVIQTIPASAIPFEVASISSSDQMLKNNLQGLAGYFGTQYSGAALQIPPNFNRPTFNAVEGTSDDIENRVKDYLIPLPFSTMFYLKDNLETRLMEDLEIVVKTRLSPIQYETGQTREVALPIEDRHELELTLDYIQFHGNVEEVIRNENFKPDVPAALLQSDYEVHKAIYSSSETSGSLGTRVIYKAPLNTDGLITDIFVVPKVHPSNLGYERYSRFEVTGFHFELFSGGISIMSGFKAEYDGIESLQYSTVTRQYQNEGVLPLRWSRCGTRIRLALNNTDEYFDGGISFQSLVAPELVISAVYNTANPYNFAVDIGAGKSETTNLNDDPGLLEFDVVLKRKNLLRIDGNTGKISKSLES